jgi:hypothetical protein
MTPNLRCCRIRAARVHEVILSRRLSMQALRRTLGVIAVMVFAPGPVFPAEREIPAPSAITSCAADPNTGGLEYWKGFKATCEQLGHDLVTARAVSEAKWLGEYSHVFGGDRWGHVILSDGTAVRWMVRPGGLGLLTWPDGSTLHLVFCQCDTTVPGNKALEIKP